MSLVDDVDSQGGLKISRALRIDPTLSTRPMEVEVLIRRSPELLAFLECDARVPDARLQQMMEMLCARMRGQ